MNIHTKGGLLLATALSVTAVTAASYEVNVASGTQENFTSAQLAEISSGNYDEIVKTGTGILRITSDATIKNFAGKITISAGVYDVAISSGALGQANYDEASSTRVLSGAALHFSHSDKSATAYSQERIYIEGDGPVGTAYPGAIVRMGKVVYLGAVYLSNDASVGGNDMLHIPDNYSWYLQEHRLTVRNGLSFNGSYIRGLGQLYFTGGSVYLPTQAKYMTAFAGHELHFGSGVTIKCILPQKVPLAGTFVFDGDVTIDVAKDKGCTELAFYNDMRLENNATLTWNIQNLERVDCHGNITGSGSLVKAANANKPSALWLYGTNTYSGSTSIAAGGKMDVIVAMNAQSLPGWNSSRVDGACTSANTGLGFGIKTEMNAEGWNGEDITNMVGRVLGRDCHILLAVDEGDSGALTNDLTHTGKPYLGTIGGGTAAFSGFINKGSVYYLYPFSASSVITVTRPAEDRRQLEAGNLYLYQGVLHYKDARSLGHAGVNNTFFVGALAGCTPRVIFEGHTSYYNYYRVTIPQQRDGRGVVEIRDGAGVTNTCLFGNHQNSFGAVVQKGGYFTALAGSVFGNERTGGGYLEVSGGETVFPGNAYFAQLGAATASMTDLPLGMLYQTGGVVKQADKNDKVVGVGVGGHGVYYLKGGRYEGFNVVYAPRARASTDYTAGSGNITVAGAGARMQIRDSGVYLCDRDSSTGFLNLIDGGVLSVRAVMKPSKSSVGGVTLGGNRKAYVGFNGGVLQPQTSRNLFDAAYAPDHVTVYAGGAVFDTAGFDASIPVALTAPQGDGVVAVTVPNVPISGYLMPPRVVITGAGEGASAVAEFDSASGTVTGVRVTSPGWGYAADSTTVTLTGGGKSGSIACTATVAPDAGTVGLVKRGEGTLTLQGDNSYAGPTVVEGGRLRVKSAGAIPANSEVVVKGGVLEIGTGVMPARWSVDMDFTSLDRKRKYTIVEVTSATAGAVPTLPTSGLPPDWYARISGNSVKLAYLTGSVLTFR